MKKLTAVLLALLTLFSITAMSASAYTTEAVQVECTDSNPISATDVENSRIKSQYLLHESEIPYNFVVFMPDGSAQKLNPSKTAERTERYANYGYAFVDFEECEIAAMNGSPTVPVHIYVSVSEKKPGETNYTELDEYEFVIHKKLAQNYIKDIELVEGAPGFIYEQSESVNFNLAKFHITYWDGNEVILPAVKNDAISDKSFYTLNGIPFSYKIDRKENRVDISYIDNSCSIVVSNVKEFPFISVDITNCTMKGDMPDTIVYQVKWKNGKTESFSAKVNGYSGYINYLEGYAVSYSTEGSRYISTVTVRIGDIHDSDSYEIEQQSAFQRLIARIAMFLKQIFNAVFPGKE